jgi:hypothetical protein
VTQMIEDGALPRLVWREHELGPPMNSPIGGR